METLISVRELHQRVSEFINRARYGQEKFTVTSRGHAVAVLISTEEYRRLKRAAGEAE